MPRVYAFGKDLGDIRDPRLLAYYRGQAAVEPDNYQIGDRKPAAEPKPAKPAAEQRPEPQTSPAEEPSHSPEETA